MPCRSAPGLDLSVFVPKRRRRGGFVTGWEKMTKTVRSLVLAALLCAPHRGLSHAQGRAAIFESVDLLVPLAPATVAISGATHIVYELHITNLLPVDVSITRIQVTRADLP